MLSMTAEFDEWFTQRKSIGEQSPKEFIQAKLEACLKQGGSDCHAKVKSLQSQLYQK